MKSHFSKFRRLLLGATLSFGAFGAVGHAAEGAYPPGSVSLVVPFAAGGTTDAIARLVADELQTRWGKPVVVENKPGAGGVIAAQTVARGKADGTQIFFNDIGMALNEVTMSKLPYNLKKDFQPVIAMADWPLAIVTGTNTGIKTLPELIEKAKTNSLSYGTFGPASSPHLAIELLKSLTGIPMKTVHYKGVGPVLQAMASGEVQVSVMGAGAAASEVRKGTMNVIALDYRSKLMPEVPTFSEAGVNGMRAIAWWGAFVPAKTPPNVVAEINAGFNAALKAPKVVQYLETNGYTPVGGAPEALQKRVDEAVALWGPLAKSAGIAAN